MIKTPTTFVVGAGASVPYGLPAGEALWRLATQLEPGIDVFQLLHGSGFNVERLRQWIDDVRRYPGSPSIDAS
jgi:hypothetical protein